MDPRRDCPAPGDDAVAPALGDPATDGALA